MKFRFIPIFLLFSCIVSSCILKNEPTEDPVLGGPTISSSSDEISSVLATPLSSSSSIAPVSSAVVLSSSSMVIIPPISSSFKSYEKPGSSPATGISSQVFSSAAVSSVTWVISSSSTIYSSGDIIYPSSTIYSSNDVIYSSSSSVPLSSIVYSSSVVISSSSMVSSSSTTTLSSYADHSPIYYTPSSADAVFTDGVPALIHFKDKFSIVAGDVPKNQFKAHYFRYTGDSTLLFTELVKHPSINYAWDDFLNIDSEDFGAYYIGDIFYAANTPVEFAVDQSRSRTKIHVNGVEIFNSESDQRVTHIFSAGYNIVEVEFYNDWHTSTFSVKPYPPLPVATPQVYAQLFDPYTDVDIWYGGLYECSDRLNRCTISIGPTVKPTFIYLSSYHATDWDLTGIDLYHIKGVFVSSLGPTSLVFGLPETIPVYQLSSAVYNFDNRSEAASLVFSQTGGRSLTGFNGSYGPTSLMLSDN